MNLVLPTIFIASALAISSIGGINAQIGEKAAPPPAESNEEWKPDLAWVDPVITGPVSEEYKRVREEAGCDEARWPNIPEVCFPD